MTTHLLWFTRLVLYVLHTCLFYISTSYSDFWQMSKIPRAGAPEYGFAMDFKLLKSLDKSCLF